MSESDLSVPETAIVTEADNVLPGAGPAWQEQDGLLREMWLNNQTPQAISEVLNRSIAAIMTRAARLGLPRRTSPGRKPGQHRRDQGQTNSTTRPPNARVVG